MPGDLLIGGVAAVVVIVGVVAIWDKIVAFLERIAARWNG
jgi:hypothetical protein